MATLSRDPTNVGCSHPLRVQIAGNVPHVKTGTPIRPTPNGYVIALPNEEPEAYAAAHAEGSQDVAAYRSVTLDIHQDLFKPGDRFDITDIDDYGNLTIEKDDEGPYTATGVHTITLDVMQWKIRKIRKRLRNAIRNAQLPEVREEAHGEVRPVTPSYRSSIEDRTLTGHHGPEHETGNNAGHALSDPGTVDDRPGLGDRLSG